MVSFEQLAHVALIGKAGDYGQPRQVGAIADTGAKQADAALRLQCVRCHAKTPLKRAEEMPSAESGLPGYFL